MKIHTNQAGVAPLVIVLSILVVGVVGFAAYRVGKSDNKSNNEATATNTNSQPIASQQPEKTIPEGFEEYRNKELGFKFIYPEGWGEVEFKDNKSPETAKGKNYTLSFTKKPEMKATIRTKDFKFSDTYGRGGAYFDAPTTWKEASSDQKDTPWNDRDEFGYIVVSKTDNRIIFQSCSGFTSSALMGTYVKLSSSAEVGYFYYLLRGHRDDGSGADLRGCENMAKLFQPIVKEFTQFAESIETL